MNGLEKRKSSITISYCQLQNKFEVGYQATKNDPEWIYNISDLFTSTNTFKFIGDFIKRLGDYILSLGDDISESHLKPYAAFKKIRNVVTVVAQKKKLILNLPLDVSTVSFEEGFSRDVTNIGHWGCGAVELYLQSSVDFEKAKPLIDRAFDEN